MAGVTRAGERASPARPSRSRGPVVVIPAKAGILVSRDRRGPSGCGRLARSGRGAPVWRQA